MESTSMHMNHLGATHRLIPFIAPALLVSVSYVDPGKWAAIVEGGARFGFDLFVLVLLFSFAAILCQYLSASIGVVTGKGLAEICSNEYDKCTCILLGIQAEVSVILLDLTMILGISHGLNLLFGWDLFTSVLLTGAAAVFFPLLANLLEDGRAKFLYICMAGFILLSLVLGVLMSQPEIPVSMNLMLTKLNGESAFTLMSLLGASIMPHNFYVHSSFVQHHQGPPNVSKEVMCSNHLFAIFCIFTGLYLVNNVLMNSAANVFYSPGLVLHTFPDALSLMEQVYRSPVVYVLFLLVLFLSNQITALTWSLGGQLVLTNFLKLDIPGWLHCATIRIVAIIPALYCVWTSGAEGMYQFLIFSQVMVALLLPSSVIPLFRVAASRPIMGAFKISQLVEFLALGIFIGMLGLKIIFVVEMMFGNSDWVVNLRWNMGSGMSIVYVVLLITACSSFCLMLWLAATPLKSATAIAQLDAQAWNCWDIPKEVPDLSAEREDINLGKSTYPLEAMESHSNLSAPEVDSSLPENIMESDHVLGSINQVENRSNSAVPSSPKYVSEECLSTDESVLSSTVNREVSDSTLADMNSLKIDSAEPIGKTVGMDIDLRSEKDDYEVDNWEAEESLQEISRNPPSLTSEGPGSFKSIGGRSEEGGNGTGSFSKLAGLGRAARRQLTVILDEFWGQLYDLHGQATPDATIRKLDILLGIDSKLVTSSLKLDASAKEFPGYLSSVGSKASDPITSSLYDSPKGQGVQSGLESPYGVQKGHPSPWSNHMQLLDAYVHNSSYNVVDPGEKRYSSLRNLSSSESWDYQPATVHGYQFSSYLNRMAKDRSFDHLNGQLGSSGFKSQSLGGANLRDSLAFAMGQKLQNGLGTCQTPSPGLQNLTVSRNPAPQPERPYFERSSSGASDNLSSVSNTKKYHSLPDIHRDLHVSDKNSQWDNVTDYGSSMGRTTHVPSYANSGSRAVLPLAFDELSPSKSYNGAVSQQTNPHLNPRSLWSRQPFEQFGLNDKNGNSENKGVGGRVHSISQKASFVVNSEARLLQSFRHCIVKLMKLEGSDWLFGQSDGADEELIDSVAARERFFYEAEAREMNQMVRMKESPHLSSDRRSSSGMKNNDTNFTNLSISSVPHCGEGCVWRSDLIVSFGVWCIHRILDLSLMESRPELWGKYTYVLNRLQGIIDPAFSKPRIPMPPCYCFQISQAFQQRSSPPIANGMLPPAAKPGKGKCTTAAVLLELVKDVEIAISCRKGRTGTAAGDVAFPKGKENLASVLKRYKRKLSNKPVATHEASSTPRKLPVSSVPFSS